jgi:hypothetical protein
MKAKILIMVLPSLLLAAIRARSQEAIPATKNYPAWAQEFLRSMYPSLNQKKLLVTAEGLFAYDEVGAQERWLTISVGNGPKGQYSKVIGGWEGWTPPPKDFHGGPQYYEQFLTAGFTFDKNDHLVSYAASGPAIGNADVEGEYFEFVDAHPSLTRAQIDRKLSQTKVKYGPGQQEEFTKHLPLGELSRFLGHIDGLSVEPNVVKTSDSGEVEWVRWKVSLTASVSGGERLAYVLSFDPFDGELVSLLHVPQSTFSTK